MYKEVSDKSIEDEQDGILSIFTTPNLISSRGMIVNLSLLSICNSLFSDCYRATEKSEAKYFQSDKR